MQIGIQYIDGLLDESELTEIRAIAEEHDYELKENDIRGKAFAQGGDFARLFLSLSPALLEAIATGVVSSTMYDALKTIVGKVARALSGKTFTIVRPGNNFTETKAKLYLRGARSNLEIELLSENAEAIDSAIRQAVEAFKDANK